MACLISQGSPAGSMINLCIARLFLRSNLCSGDDPSQGRRDFPPPSPQAGRNGQNHARGKPKIGVVFWGVHMVNDEGDMGWCQNWWGGYIISPEKKGFPIPFKLTPQPHASPTHSLAHSLTHSPNKTRTNKTTQTNKQTSKQADILSGHISGAPGFAGRLQVRRDVGGPPAAGFGQRRGWPRVLPGVRAGRTGAEGIRSQSQTSLPPWLGSLFWRFLGVIKVRKWGCFPLTHHFGGDFDPGKIRGPAWASGRSCLREGSFS